MGLKGIRWIVSSIAVLGFALSVGVAQSAETGTIEGRVTDQDGNPLEKVCVSASFVKTETDADGTYSLTLEPGSHAVEFRAPNFGCSSGTGFVTRPHLGYQNEWYANASSKAEATEILVVAGAASTADAILDLVPFATITGNVTHRVSGLPIANLPIDGFMRDIGYVPPLFIFMWGAETEGDGTYAMDVSSGLAVSVSFGWRWGDLSDIKYYDSVTDQQLSRTFSLSDGEVASNVDADVGLASIELLMDRLVLVDAGGQWLQWGRLAENDPRVRSYYFGNPGDLAFAGDWDCDGEATPGLYRQSDGYVYLRNSNTEGVADITFFFGNPGDVPIAGDFNGDDCDTVSIYRPSEGRFYIINQLGTADGGLGSAEFDFYFGNPGDKPFVGDFDGNGVDEVGLHRESTGRVYFRTSLSQGPAQSDFVYGDPGDVLLTGDWNLDGADSVAVYRPSTGELHIRRTNTAGNADYSIYVGEHPTAVILRDGVANLVVSQLGAKSG